MTRLLITILVTMLTGTALAQGSGDAETEPWSTTLTCSGALPSGSVSCFLEERVLTLGDLEVSIGIDASLVGFAFDEAEVAAYGVVAYYEETWNAWAELALPRVLPPLGRPDPFRVGFTVRF